MERRVTTPTQRPRTVPGKAIQSLLLEMDAIRQETISSGDMKYSPKSGIGKDVSIIIGRIEKGGLTRPSTSGAQVGIVRETPQPLLSSAHVSNNNDPERRKKMERSGRSRPAPKSPKSSRPTETFRKSPLGEIGSTASAKSFKELTSSKRHPDSRTPIPLRPSSSYFYSSTLEGSGSKGSGGKSKAKVKSTRSTIGTLRREMGEAGGDATATAAVVAADGDKSSPALTLKEQFAAFSCFGDKSSDGKSISLTNCDKWMKQAKVIDGKKITTTDTSILFKKLFKTAKKVGFEDFKKYVEELATSKKIEGSELTGKLVNCGPPGLSSATRAAHTGVIERLTDTKKYTGSHKERFDATGKGRGIEGRREAGKSPAAVVRPKPAVAAAAENNGSPSPSPVPPAKE